ncbi:MAG: glycosyltransferase family 39 protein [Roseiflexus sp.]|nr:glycosyltransferase family 39 protein [Roseiflexus sp.]MCS7288465.1 glycosyltransferase family 39 protein [Roseiflexus sp.]MDW8233286.1 glycosyltransferase family 39 protein [Roseiflexaceae bacterium]
MSFCRLIALSAGALAVVCLLFINQPLYPPPWFDEGLNAGTAATLARSGLYALPDPDRPRVLDPAIQTGPTVIVPIALAYRVFGPSIWLARMVMLPFAALACVMFILVARRLVGDRGAALATLFLLTGTYDISASFVPMARQVLGEVPALAFLLLGLLIWLRSLERETQAPLAWAFSGIAWGLAMVTKSQVLILVPVALGVILALDRLYYRRAGWLAVIVPGGFAAGCVAVWYAAQIAIVGSSRFQDNASVLREGFWLHIASLDPERWRNALGVIGRTGWWLWGVPAVIWGVYQARQRTFQGFVHAALMTLLVVNLLWFAALSIGWARYAFYFLVLTTIPLAGLVLAFWNYVALPAVARKTMVVLLCVAYVVSQGLPDKVISILRPSDNGYADMVTFLRNQVPPHATILSWEWELSVESNHRIIYPPTRVTNEYTRHLILRQQLPEHVKDDLPSSPDYVLVGRFGAWTKIYHEIIASPRAQLVAERGVYRLYRIVRQPVSDAPLTPHSDRRH